MSNAEYCKTYQNKQKAAGKRNFQRMVTDEEFKALGEYLKKLRKEKRGKS